MTCKSNLFFRFAFIALRSASQLEHLSDADEDAVARINASSAFKWEAQVEAQRPHEGEVAET